MDFNWKLIEEEVFSQRFGSIGVTELKKILFAVYVSGSPDVDDYSLGRKLGLTDRQVRNYRVGANLLLDSEEQTKEVVRESLWKAVRSSQIEYQEFKNRISVQIDSQIALEYLSSQLRLEGIFRECDAANGHIAVPVDRFFWLIMLAFPDFDESCARAKVIELFPDFAALADEGSEKNFMSKLAEWLPTVETAMSIAVSLASCVEAGLQAYGMI